MKTKEKANDICESGRAGTGEPVSAPDGAGKKDSGARRFGWRFIAACAGAFVLGAGLLLLFHTHGKLIRPFFLAHLLWLVPLFIFSWFYGRQSSFAGLERRAVPSVVLCGFMVLYLCSSAVEHGWFYFLRWGPQGGPGFQPYGMLLFVFIAAMISPFLVKGFHRRHVILFLVLVLLQFLCFLYLWAGTGGSALYSDDHPSFLFRLYEFRATFPQLINYNPFWNGGVVDNVGTTSGTIAFGLPFFPLLQFARVEQVYTLMFAILYIGVVPWLAVMSVRIVGGSRAAAFCGGIVALGVSRHFFLWILNYGTIGACFATSFLVPVSACAFRVVKMRRMEKRIGVVLVISAFFLLLWPPGAIMGLCVGLAVLLHFRSWSAKKILFLAVCGVLAAVLYSRNLIVLLFANHDLFGFVLEPGIGAESAGLDIDAEFWKNGFMYIAAHIQEGHPALVFLGIGGLLACGKTSLALWYLPIILALAFFTGWGSKFSPNLQLGRMAIPMMFAAIVPAAFAMDRIFKTKHPLFMLARALLVSLLLLGGWNAARIYGNQGRERYVTRSELVCDVTDWISENVPEGGRLLFAGRTVHVCGRGHVAILPMCTGREMMACDYYHFPTTMVEYEYPPRAFRGSPERKMEFFDLYNVAAIMTYHNHWKDYFRQRPDWFEESTSFNAGGGHVITAFLLKRPAPGMFYRGAGSVRADFNIIEVEPADPDAEIVLRYNWHSNLRVEPPAEIYPVEVDEYAVFIGLRPRGADKIVVKYKDL